MRGVALLYREIILLAEYFLDSSPRTCQARHLKRRLLIKRSFFRKLFDVLEHSLMNEMDASVAPQRPVSLRIHLEFIPSAPFE